MKAVELKFEEGNQPFKVMCNVCGKKIEIGGKSYVADVPYALDRKFLVVVCTEFCRMKFRKSGDKFLKEEISNHRRALRMNALNYRKR